MIRISGVKINTEQNVEEMNQFYKEFADEIVLVDYDPWESAYENKINNRTLKFIANGLSNFENGINVDIPDAIAVSISLMNDHEGDKVNSTMTGQMYIDTVDNYTKILQLFHVLKTDNNDLNSALKKRCLLFCYYL